MLAVMGFGLNAGREIGCVYYTGQSSPLGGSKRGL
jgi:hypothetical protein